MNSLSPGDIGEPVQRLRGDRVCAGHRVRQRGRRDHQPSLGEVGDGTAMQIVLLVPDANGDYNLKEAPALRAGVSVLPAQRWLKSGGDVLGVVIWPFLNVRCQTTALSAALAQLKLACGWSHSRLSIEPPLIHSCVMKRTSAPPIFS